MLVGIISLVLIVAAISLFKKPIDDKSVLATRLVQIVLLLVGVFGLASRSFVIVDANQVGHLKRVYLAADLPPGKIIAAQGEKGPQAEILGPGFHFIPLVKILYDVEYAPVVSIPDGSYGILKAQDGLPLRPGQFIADAWPKDNLQKMLDARFFLTEGKGQKGPQLDVLPPGKYRLNHYLFTVQIAKALDVPTGHVAVIRSKVQTRADCSHPHNITGGTDQKVSALIVPDGCIGVSEIPKPPGAYYLNKLAYESEIVPTRVQTWTYKGGYTKRQIDLRLDEDGKIHQKETSENIPVPDNAADAAINVRAEGWNVPVELRVIVQVQPSKAPIVIASVGSLENVEDKIITPAIRDILRTIGGHPERKVLDFMNKRDEIVKLMEAALEPEGEKVGITIKEVRLGEPYIPPELLVAAQRENLANQLRLTYVKEQEAQKQRISVERERATADQQSTLVAAEIAKQAAAFKKSQLQLEGEGQKLKLVEIAKGQQAQADVLGKERAMQLQALEKALDAAVKNPDIVKIPTVLVNGSAGGYEGAAAVLGASNLLETMKGLQKPVKVTKE
ncbi:MAG: hypothetical protein GC149_09645 [Gammaproteobacteria bacterium]|nr:hypothetical protein [Gammaproteobacteria bacterium]